MQIRSASLLLTCGVLAACGGGGGGVAGATANGAPTPTQEVIPPEPTPRDEPTGETTTPETPIAPEPEVVPETPVREAPPLPSEPVDLSFFAFDPTSGEISTGTGRLDAPENQVSLASASGVLNEDKTQVALEEGGQITLLSFLGRSTTLFQFEPASGNPSFGVLGQATDMTAFSPEGTARYIGTDTAIVQIIDDSDLYDLTGDVTIDVDFDTSLVDFDISGLDGQRTDGLSAPVDVSDVAQIGISGGRLRGNTYAGGAATFASGQIAIGLSGAESIASTGGLFGENASEAGGVFVIDDTDATGNLLIQGQYIAE